MLWHRRTRFFTALFALLSLLFMQLAVAGYACPSERSSQAAEIAAMAEAGMPCAETMSLSMDDEQPNLCRAHCQAGQQTADKYELPPLAAAVVTNVVHAASTAMPNLDGPPVQGPLLHRATSPPLAIQHCCFRI